MRSRTAETDIVHEWIDGAPAGTVWHRLSVDVAGHSAAMTVYGARCALRNAVDTQRRARRAWRAVEVRVWVVDLAPRGGRVYGLLEGLLATTDVDAPAVADALACSRTWQDVITVDGPLTAGEARAAAAEMIEAWGAVAWPDAGSRRVVIGSRSPQSPGIRARDLVHVYRDPMPWLM
ncbi:hypothetical protein [Methylobacterium sp. JK268]